jgi:hypothetical protein
MSSNRDRSDGEIVERAARSAERVVALADGHADGFDLAGLADRLVLDCVDLLDVSAAGVLLTSAHSQDLVAASDEPSRRIELVELETVAGPGRHAVRTGEPETHANGPGLATRWPSFAAAVDRAGYAMLHTIPMRHSDDTVGALTLFCEATVPCTELDRRMATSLASAATVAINHHRAVDRLSILAEQLQGALNTRIVIERAIGVVAEYSGVEMGAAFDAIRSYARRTRTRLDDVARALTTRSLHPGQVIEARTTDPGG